MTVSILFSMGISLGMTLILEMLFAWLWGIRGRRELILCMLANILTNPIVTSTYYYFKYGVHAGNTVMVIITAFLEISAVIAEWRVYKYASDMEKPFLFSLCANGFSYFSGIVIGMIF